MKKIRLIKDLPWAKAGEEFEVNNVMLNGECIEIFRTKGCQRFTVSLSELEGWYEEAQWEPIMNEAYKFITDEFIIARTERTCLKDERRIEGGNCFHPGSTDAGDALKRLLAFRKN